MWCNLQVEGMAIQVDTIGIEVDRTLVQVDTIALQVSQNPKNSPKKKRSKEIERFRNQSRSMNANCSSTTRKNDGIN
jgi:hypothetical protein